MGTVIDRFALERQLWDRGLQHIAGVDEAGRGPLAGPVVAAAVIFPRDFQSRGLPPGLVGLNDSKQLTASQRDRYFEALMAHGEIRSAVARVDPAVVDEINILQATYRAMIDAVSQLQPEPEHVLVDGHQVPPLPFPRTPVVKGDSLSYSIAAASVLAKVTRDRLMLEYDRQWPAYGFALHKGYGTPQHLAALAVHGPCPIHRRSFAPVHRSQMELF